MTITPDRLRADLSALGVQPGDGLFVHASMRSIGAVEGGAPAVIKALLSAISTDGLLGMPGFTEDAVVSDTLPRSTADRLAREAAVPGYEPLKSPTHGMGAIAETFRTWPGTRRSAHPVVSICLNGPDVDEFLEPHQLAWATGAQTPLGHLRNRAQMKMLLVGVGWNRCTALHTAESLAKTKRTKIRRFLLDGEWVELPDVANDNDRLFPNVGRAFEETGSVTIGRFGDAKCRLCDYAQLIEFATKRIDAANRESGDRH